MHVYPLIVQKLSRVNSMYMYNYIYSDIGVPIQGWSGDCQSNAGTIGVWGQDECPSYT